MTQLKISYKEIRKLWECEYPMLKKLTPSCWMLKADIALIGLEFYCHFDEYFVDLAIYPLWHSYPDDMRRHALCTCLSKQNRRLHFTIQYHQWDYSKIIEYFHNNFDCCFQKEISIACLIDVIKRDWEYSFRNDYLNPTIYKPFYEFILGLALYFDDPVMKAKFEKHMRKTAATWHSYQFKSLYKMTIDEWLAKVEEEFSDRDRFMNVVRENSDIPKIRRLNEAHLKYVPADQIDLSRLPQYFHIGKMKFRKWWLKK